MSESNGRRWGRVTVEGWIDECSSVFGQIGVSPTIEGLPAAYFYWKSNASVEFLPEPVTFKDGDVVRGLGGSNWYVRRDGQWDVLSSDGDEGCWVRPKAYDDQQMSAWLARRLAVRLVPEGNDDRV
jgi:hypothetical protein